MIKKILIKMKKILVFVLFNIIMFQFLACSFFNKELPDNIRIRLSMDHNKDWGNEAIGFSKLSQEDIFFVPKIVVLDTGCSIKNDNIFQGYNILDNSNDVSTSDSHGDIVISKLLDLICVAKIIPIKISQDEDIEHLNLSEGLKKAISLQPDIISLSLGTKKNYSDIAEITGDAIKQGIIIIAAVGNQFGDELLFPASYDGVIRVMARDINNIDCAYNNKSEHKRSFSAPGEHILVNGQYISGSSIAVPYVTAIVSQMIAVSGRGKLDVNSITQILSDTALYPTKYSYGLVQYNAAILETLVSHNSNK
jgi:hypothetical protein